MAPKALARQPKKAAKAEAVDAATPTHVQEVQAACNDIWKRGSKRARGEQALREVHMRAPSAASCLAITKLHIEAAVDSVFKVRRAAGLSRPGEAGARCQQLLPAAGQTFCPGFASRCSAHASCAALLAAPGRSSRTRSSARRRC